MSTSAITMVSAVTDVVKVLCPKTVAVAAQIIFSY
ncbi:Protein of unknown function [Bacillus wiedmannii]|nr:Protein of unknown function [Bacillus wiedmannii]